MIIGNFEKTGKNLVGTIETLAFTVEAIFEPVSQKKTSKSPDYSLLSGRRRIGAAWKKTGQNSGSPQDSTSYASNGTITGTVTQGAAGKFGTAISLAGSGYIVVTNPADHHLDFGTSSFSNSAWVNTSSIPASYYAFIFKGGSPVAQPGYNTYADNNPALACTVTDNSGTHQYSSADISYSNNTWYHMVETVDTTALKLHFYLNGAEVSGSPYSISPLASTTSTMNLYLGANSGGSEEVKGKMQEVHIISGVESADWIATDYNNQNSPSTFYTVGSAVSR